MIGAIGQAIGEGFVKGCLIYVIVFVLIVAAAFGVSWLIVDGWWWRIGCTIVIVTFASVLLYQFKIKEK